jgi:hypothetical protein
MKIIKKYFENKIQMMRVRNVDETIIRLVEKNFEERYQYVANYYNISNLLNEENFRNIR